MIYAKVPALAAIAAMLASVEAGTCMQCFDDFATFQTRRGRGATTNNQGWVSPIIAGTAVGQYSDPSPHWRNDYDGVTDTNLFRQIIQGPSNFWIDPFIGQLKFARVEGTGTGLVSRTPVDLAGPLMPRTGSPTISTTLTTTYAAGDFAASSEVLNGRYGGVYYLAEGWGNVDEFEELAADFAVYDPVGTTGNLPVGASCGSTVGLVFNARTGRSGRTFYAVLARNQTGAAGEVGISLIRVGASSVATLVEVNSVSIPVNRQTSAIMDLNGPRVWARIHASRINNVINVWLNGNKANPIISFTESLANALPAGMVGISAIGAHAAVFDNILLNEKYDVVNSVNNGVPDGDEFTRDCGGNFTAACGISGPLTWRPSLDGHFGWTHTQYGDNPNGFIFGVPIMYPEVQHQGTDADFMVMPSNANGPYPGSFGSNSASWTGAWTMTNVQWPVARDIDMTVELQPGDNDYVGLTWRYVDRDNHYILNARTETATGTPRLTIQRRRNGVNVVIWQSPAGWTEVLQTVDNSGTLPQTGTTNPSWLCDQPTLWAAYSRYPFHSCLRQRWRVVMRGSRIELYWPPVDTWANLQANALNPRLLVSFSDPDPLPFPGQVGLIVTTHDHLRVWEFTVTPQRPVRTLTGPALALPISTASRNALAFAVEARAHAPPASGSTGTAVAVYDYSPNRRILHTSPFMVPATQVPTVQETQCGIALRMNGAQNLYSHLRSVDGDPGIIGFTLVAVFEITTAPAAGINAVVAAKGFRTAALANAPGQAGWRLLVADRGSGLRVFFEARSQSYFDSLASISHPYTLGSRVTVIVQISPDFSVGLQQRVDNRGFLAAGFVNGVAMADLVNNQYNGTIATGESADLFVGSLEDGTAGMTGLVHELQTYRGVLPLAELTELNDFMSRKHAAGSTTCPNLSTVGLNLTTTTFTTASACTSPVAGSVCQMACAPGHMLIAGGLVATCSGTSWVGNLPICVPGCSVNTATSAANQDVRPCSMDLLSENWPIVRTSGLNGCGVDPSLWSTAPAGATVWSVTTPGTLRADANMYIDVARIFAQGNYINSEPGLTVAGSASYVEGQLPFPAVGAAFETNPVSFIEMYPRYVDPANYYAVRITAVQGADTIGGITALSNTTTFIRVRLGVTVTLCSALPGSIPYVPSQLSSHRLVMTAESAFTVTTNGVTWCTLPREDALPLGDPGYGISGAGVYNFGPIRAGRSFPLCPTSTLRSTVPVNARVETQCSPGFAATGTASRTCQDNGLLSGTPLTCVALPPQVNNPSVVLPEMSPEGTIVASLPAGAVARGSSVLYTIVSGNFGNAFTVGGCDGVVRVATPSALDFEQITGNRSFVLTVRAEIVNAVPASVSTATVTVTVTDANDPPMLSNTVCSVNENSARDSTVCNLNVVDIDTATPDVQLSIVAQDVAGVFALSGSALVVATPALNFEGRSTYSVTVRVQDRAIPASFSVQQVTILINDVPEAPMVAGPINIIIPSQSMTTGRQLGQFIQATDEDVVVGSRIVGYSLRYSGASQQLLRVDAVTGELISDVNTASTYTLAGLFNRDGRVLAAYSEVFLRATDDTPIANGGARTGELFARIYVEGNDVIASGSPVIRRVSVAAADATSGAGTTGQGVSTLATSGADVIVFSVDNLVVIPASTMSLNGTTTDTFARSWVTTCSYDGITRVGPNDVAASVRCPSSPGFGIGWSWTLLQVVGVTSSPIVAATGMTFTYALPIIASIQPENTLNSISTAAGTAVILSGHNFGARLTGVNVAVRYGQADPTTGVVNWQFTLTLSPADVTHNTIRGFLQAGDGANLQFEVTVGGRAVASGALTTMNYGAPVINNITLADTTLPLALNGAGGDVLIITGSNLGAGRTGLPILHYGPFIPGMSVTPANLPMKTISATTGLSTCIYQVPHTVVRCNVVGGVGRNLIAVLTHGGVASAIATTAVASAAAAQRLSFALPAITGISGPGSRDMDTKGGQTFILTGQHFGPAAVQGPGRLYSPPTVTYGPRTQPTRWMATDCAVVGVNTISCLTAEGHGGAIPVGTGFSFIVTAGNQTSTAWQAPARCEYGNPKVNSVTLGLSMSAAGSTLAPFLTGPNAVFTEGGQIVNIRGKNFGFFNQSDVADSRGLSYSVAYYSDMDLRGDGNLTQVRFNARNCLRYTPTNDGLYLPLRQYHEQIYCEVAPGSGQDLKWEVIVAGKISNEPTTSYQEPVIAAVSTSNSQPIRASQASDLGGTTVYLHGDFFGPLVNPTLTAVAALRMSNFVQWVRYGPDGAAGNAVYDPLSWSLSADHQLITVVLAPGIGKNLVFQVSVADQVSPIPANRVSGPATFDFADPKITRLEPDVVGTTGGATVRLFITGGGLLDPTASHIVTLGGQPVPIVERFPDLESVRSAAGLGQANFTTTLSPEQLNPANHYVAVTVPPGVGANVPFIVRAFRALDSGSFMESNEIVDGAASWLDYTPPVLEFVSIERVTNPVYVDLARQWRPDATAAEIADMRVMTMIGENFGPANSGRLLVQLSNNTLFTTVTLGYVVAQTDTQITVLVEGSSGFARVAVESTAPGTTTPTYIFTDIREYTDLSPSVQAILGQPADGYNTAGGQLAIVKARNLNSFVSLIVQVGNSTAVFRSVDNTRTITLAELIQSAQNEAAEQAGRGIGPADMEFTVAIQVPQGQGSSVPVVLIRDGVVGSGVSTIRYALPTITSMRHQPTGLATPAANINALNPHRVPTTGGILSIVGTNLGTCPVFFWGVHRGAACPQQRLPTDQLILNAPRTHTAVSFRIPEGAGSGNGLWTASVIVGDQSTFALPVAYMRPVVTSIVPLTGDGMPTTGGTMVSILGSNFGNSNFTNFANRIYLDWTPTERFVRCASMVRSEINPHNNITCRLPAGSGALLDVYLRVEDQNQTNLGVFSYDAPVISSVTNIGIFTPGFNGSAGAWNDTEVGSSYGLARGRTQGGYDVMIVGRNFGPAYGRQPTSNHYRHCLFMPASNVPDSSLLCDRAASNWDEIEIVGDVRDAVAAAEGNGLIRLWNHTHIIFTQVAGMGVHNVTVWARGGISRAEVEGSDQFTYEAPVIESVEPTTAETNVPVAITVRGRNFGFGSTADANRRRVSQSYVPLTPVLPRPNQAGAFPSQFGMRVNFFSASRCVTSAVRDDSNVNLAPLGVSNCVRDDASQPEGVNNRGVEVHGHNMIRFWSLPGVGTNRTLSLSIVSAAGTVNSNPWSFSYTPAQLNDAVIGTIPQFYLMTAPVPVRDESFANPLRGWYLEPQTVVFEGSNFGPVDMTSSDFSDEERAVEVSIDGMRLTDAVRTARGLPARPVIRGSYPAYAANVFLPMTSIPTVGFKFVDSRIAGQRALAHRFNLKQAVCRAGFYGLPGEVCDECPVGAVCEGYEGDLQNPRIFNSNAGNVVRYGTYNVTSYMAPNGLNVTECVHCFTSPRPLAGYYNMKGRLNTRGESESICSDVRKAEGRRTAAQCDFVVACDPPEACLPDNVCADGYTNRGWPYRCSQCETGFYRSAGNCRRCPDNPALNVVFFFVVAVAAIALGWFLNQKQINIAFLTIGLDYMQVISIFASTRVNWPPQMKELFRILSAFNLNIEIVAPECAFAGITYSNKFGAIMALPVAVFVILMVCFVVNALYLVFVRGQSKKQIPSLASPLIAMGQVLMYFLYLYLTRTVFDVMTCRSLDPPEYDSQGRLKLFMAGLSSEQCGVSGGVQLSLLPGAIAGLVFYVLVYPAVVGWNLYSNRELVMEDQLLRAKRVGDDKLTNPNALEFRRRFARTYYQFRPELFLWVLAILLRKFLIAISSLVFNTNQNFQMAAMLLVLFMAYAAQVRFVPYMGPGNFEAVLREHEKSAKEGDAVHVRLQSIIAKIQAQGRKRTHANTFGGAQTLTMGNLAGALGRFLFDYNTVEAILLASALLVALSGVMFGATDAKQAGSFYKDSRDGVMSAILIVVALSIIYWLTVVVVEIYVMVMEQQLTTRKVKAAGKGKGKNVEGDEEETAANRMSLAAMGPVETLTNPMFTSQDGKGGSKGSAMSVDTITQIEGVPEGAVWMAVREAFLQQSDRAAAAAAEVARLKADVAKARMASAANAGEDDEGNSTPRTATKMAAKRSFGPQEIGSDSKGSNPLLARSMSGKASPGLRLKR